MRAAKGHEIDPRSLAYKTGDEFQAAARGKSTQQAVFVDSTGRAYSLLAHTLPSARGQGEPLSGRIDPPDGATFAGVVIGDAEERCVLASDAGYGFVVKLSELHSRNRAGKAVLKVPEGSGVVTPCMVPAHDKALICAVSSEGKMWYYLKDCELSKGKAKSSAHSGQERQGRRKDARDAVVALRTSLLLWAGPRKMSLISSAVYRGERAQRGAVCRGWRGGQTLEWRYRSILMW